jgi:hypothetical protein
MVMRNSGDGPTHDSREAVASAGLEEPTASAELVIIKFLQDVDPESAKRISRMLVSAEHSRRTQERLGTWSAIARITAIIVGAGTVFAVAIYLIVRGESSAGQTVLLATNAVALVTAIYQISYSRKHMLQERDHSGDSSDDHR